MTSLRLATALTVVASFVFGQSLPQGVKKNVSLEGITEYQLDNGMKVLLFPDPSKPTVTVNITYLVGSKHENYGETGMAHLLEHLVFKGTQKRGNLIKELQEHGARFNGTTWLDRTNYYETLNASDENLEWALEMEADRMVNSKIAKSDLDSEMTVVRNEFEAGENSPMRVLLERALSSAFDWHNYGKSTIGARSDIENVPIDRLQGFYRKYYQPDNALLVVAGKFDESKTLGWIVKNFAPIPRPSRKLDKIWTSEPVQDGERSVTVRRVGDVQYVMSVYHIPAGTHPDFPAVETMSTILGDNPSGRLYKALVDNKKAASILNMDFQLSEPGVAIYGARVRTEQSLDEARQILLRTIEDLAKEPPSKEEVDRAKTKLLKQIELNLNDAGRVGVELSEWASMADWRMLFVHRDRLGKVTPEDVQRVAKNYLKESNRTLGAFIPTKTPDRAEISAPPPIDQVLKDYKGGVEIAQGEAFDPSPSNIDSRTKTTTLANGMKLVLLSKKTRGNTVHGRLALRFGDVNSLKGKSHVSRLTSSMLMRGTKKSTRQQIQDTLDKLKARVQMGGGPSSGIVNAQIETVRGNLPAVLRLVAEVLREPSFPDNEFEPVRQAQLAGIENQKSEPMFLAMNGLNKHLTRYPKGDPREVLTAEEDVEELKKVTLAEARQFHADFYGASNASLAVAGDFDEAEIQKLAAELFGDWKSPKPYQRVIRDFQTADAVNQSIQTNDKANAMFAVGMPLKINDDHPDYPALLMANYMFGGSANSRLFNRLRQKEGWSYGAASQFMAPTQEDAGVFMAYAILAPQNINKLESGYKEEVERMLKEGFPAEEVTRAKSSWMQGRVVNRSSDQFLVGPLGSNFQFSRTMSWDAELEKKVQALTPEQIHAAAKKYLDPAKVSYFKAGDFKKAGVTP